MKFDFDEFLEGMVIALLIVILVFVLLILFKEMNLF